MEITMKIIVDNSFDRECIILYYYYLYFMNHLNSFQSEKHILTDILQNDNHKFEFKYFDKKSNQFKVVDIANIFEYK